jgi:hydroxymethylpyrimidine pyrophosphatase-like HAD family hydrolase
MLMVDEREIYLLGRTDRAYIPLRSWNDAVRARWETLHPAAMAWVERARAEATAHGWQTSLPFPGDQMYRRGLPTIAFAAPDEAAAIQGWLAERLAAETPRLACNRNVRLVQIHDAMAGKGLVLAEMARHWHLAAEQVLAIGDSANDFSMLDGRLGFRCGAPGNADPAIKEAVRRAGGYVAEGRIGEGIVQVLRHYADVRGALQFG